MADRLVSYDPRDRQPIGDVAVTSPGDIPGIVERSRQAFEQWGALGFDERRRQLLDFKRVILNYGFMESPHIPRALSVCRKMGLKFDIMSTSFFLGRRSVVPSAQQGMPLWQDRLYIFLMRNAANPTDFFHIPPGRVVEMGTQVAV